MRRTHRLIESFAAFQNHTRSPDDFEEQISLGLFLWEVPWNCVLVWQTRLRSEQNMLILFSTYAAHIEKKYQVKENPHDMTLAGEMGNK